MATIQGIYVALFGRPADPAGLAYFNGVTNNGADLTAIGDLASTAEYQSRFTGQSNEEIVNSIYQSLFGRDGEPAGIDFFVTALENGTYNINTIAIAILDGAQGDDLATVNAKIAAANIFTAHLDLDIEVDAYQGAFAASVGRDFINTVNKDDAGTEDEADAAILRLFDQGQAPGGGNTPGNGGGVVTPPAPIFTVERVFNEIENAEELHFGGTATGAITLGLREGEGENFLTASRGGVNATFPMGDISVGSEDTVDLDTLNANIVLQNGLEVTAMASEVNGNFTISGDGDVTITGSDGAQTINVFSSGSNSIAGGQDGDTINLGAGADTIVIKGVDGELIDALADAEAQLAELQEIGEGLASILNAAQTAYDEGYEEVDVEAAQALVESFQVESQTELENDIAMAQALVDERAALEAEEQQAADELEQANQAVTAQQSIVDSAVADRDAASVRLDQALNAKTQADDKLDAGDVLLLRTSAFLVFDVTQSNSASVRAAYSADNRADVTHVINASDIPGNIKASLIAGLPEGANFYTNGHITSYLNFISLTVASYKTSVNNEVNAATGAYQAAYDRLTAANDLLQQKITTASDEQTQYNAVSDALNDHVDQFGTTDQLNGNLQFTEDRLDAYTDAVAALHHALEQDALNDQLQAALHEAQNDFEANQDALSDARVHVIEAEQALDLVKADSVIFDEDTVINFQVGNDHLELPGTYVFSIDPGVTEVAGTTLSYSVTNGVLSLMAGETKVVVNEAQLHSLLNILSNDDVVADGETIVFEYDIDGEEVDGLYVFQGHAGQADIGIKLVGVTADQVLDNGGVASLFSGQYELV